MRIYYNNKLVFEKNNCIDSKKEIAKYLTKQLLNGKITSNDLKLAYTSKTKRVKVKITKE